MMSQHTHPISHRPSDEAAVEAFLESARVHASISDLSLAEIRYKQALKQADILFGHNSAKVCAVLRELAQFYAAHDRGDEVAAVQKRLELLEEAPAPPQLVPQDPEQSQLHDKLLARRRRTAETPIARKLGAVPISMEVRHCCQILGLNPDAFDHGGVSAAWRTAISSTENNPDLGGDAEVAILLNAARDTLLHWLERHTPKLGKQFEHIVKPNNETRSS